MALYLQLVKWTDEGALGVLDEGFAEQVDETHRLAASLGGSVQGYWFVADGEWHVAALVELGESPGLLVQALYRMLGSGAVDSVKLLRLVDAAGVEAAPTVDYRAPGQ